MPEESPLSITNPPAVQVFALGGFQVLVNGEALHEHAWRRKGARQLFKMLLTRPGRRISRDEVVDVLWPESDPESTDTNLRSTLFAMRRALEPRAEGAGIDIVFSDRQSVWLRPDVELWLDADAVLKLLELARRAPDPLPLLEEAAALYAGHYLPDDVQESWAAERRDALKQSWAELQFRLSRQLELQGDPDAAARPLNRLLQADACNERAAQEAMHLFMRYGRRADAIRIYQRLVEALATELGVQPSEETAALYRHIAAGEQTELPPSVGATFRCSYPFPAPSELVGREAELALLERVLTSGRTAGQAAMVGAPAGTGKSALLGKLVQLAQAKDVLCLAGGCYEERGAVPLGPFHDALVDFLLTQPAESIRADLGNSVNDLAQVVPELRYHLDLSETSAPTVPAIDRTRAFAAVHACLRSLAERGPVLVCLEDLHAADEATLQLFHYLTRQTRRLPLMLLASYRNEEAPDNQPLAQMLAAMQRERLVQHVHVEALGREATDRLVTSLLEGSPSHGLSESLFSTTGGNPLFVEQLVLALSETGQLRRRGGVWHGTTDLQGTPQIVREVIAQRLQRLGSECRGTLAMAAVLGQTFEHPVLLAALEPVEESSLLLHLDEALTAQVLRETPSGYGFGHAFLRDAVYWELNAPRRTLLHARAAESLERFRGPHADDYAAELAHHYTLAGASTSIRSKALHYNRVAGKRAAELSSYPESLVHFNHAWEIIEQDRRLADLEVQLEVLAARGFAESEMAQYLESVATCRLILTLSNDPIERGRARKLIAFALSHTGAVSQVIEECETGLAEIANVGGPDAAEIRAVLQQLIGLMWYRRGQFAKILQLGQRMEQEAADAGPGPLLLAHKVTGWGWMGLGQVERAVEQYELAITKAQGWQDKIVLANAHETLGLQDYLAGRFAAAHEHLATSLGIFHESSNELRAVGSLHTLCRVLLAEGEHQRAKEQILEALDLELEGQERWAADAHHILGAIHVVRAEWNEATANFKHALRIRNEAGNMPGIVEATIALGFVDQCTGNWNSAAGRYADALRTAERMDPSPPRVQALRHCGRLNLLRGDLRIAAVEIGKAFDLAEAMAETLEYAPTVLAMAELRLRQGKLDEALALASTSLEHTHPLEQLVEADLLLANIQLARGETPDAARHTTDAVDHAKRLGSPRLLSLAHLAMAQAVQSLEPERATSAFQVALQYADQAGTVRDRAAILEAYAKYLRANGLRLDVADSMAADAFLITEGLYLHEENAANRQTEVVIHATA